jgi:hypothetical protein
VSRSALAHFEIVTAAVTLDSLDLAAVEEARVGLARRGRTALNAACYPEGRRE